MRATRVECHWHRSAALRRRTAVSLHSHTLHSRESLNFIPRLCRRISWLDAAIERARGGRPLDWDRAWWTPPLTPRQAWETEAAQIRDILGLHPLVSLTDHDNIDGPMHLRVLPDFAAMPVSFEWTVPWGGTFFHLGVHGLPPARAREFFRAMDGARQPEAPALLAELHREPGVLTVFNHPLWDEHAIGQEAHERLAAGLLSECRGAIHALELNGMRPWRENAGVPALAERFDLPLISGGDRHGCEPNACLNLTDAATFSEFAAEVRAGRSQVLFMPQYREHRTARVINHLWEILREDHAHGLGWRRWNDRIFYQRPDGSVESLAALWGSHAPPIVRAFVGLVNLMAHAPVRAALRRVLPPGEEAALP